MILLSRANALQIPLADQSVHCVATSPPYWGLRDYGLPPVVWGGEAGCEHEWGNAIPGDPRGGSGPNAKEAYIGDGKTTYARQVARGQFCQRCGAWRGCLGLEPTLELYVEHLVSVFREVWRVLRDDGTVWLNLGDSYAGSWGAMSYPGDSIAGRRFGGRVGGNVGRPVNSRVSGNLKPKDLVGIPWRVAFALQADGWWLRSDIIWAKGVSFCDEYSGSVMPESVNGWRWERHRVKIAKSTRADETSYHSNAYGDNPQGARDGRNFADHSKEYTDCPGCPKCEANDGYVLRRGSWRPTKAHEYVFMLAKSADYFCDAEAVKEGKAQATITDMRTGDDGHRRNRDLPANRPDQGGTNLGGPDGKRNPRTVWMIPTALYSGAHFATFPPALVEPCIKAGTSERGVCSVCGAPWARVVEISDPEGRLGKGGYHNYKDAFLVRGKCNVFPAKGAPTRQTTGWRPTCDHEASPIPAIVLDPFCGSGTTLQEARRLGRRSVGLDLSTVYLADNARERLQLAALDAWENGSESVVAVLDGLPLFEIVS